MRRTTGLGYHLRKHAKAEEKTVYKEKKSLHVRLETFESNMRTGVWDYDIMEASEIEISLECKPIKDLDYRRQRMIERILLEDINLDHTLFAYGVLLESMWL